MKACTKKRNFEGEVTLYVFIPEEMPETKTKGLYHGYIGINESVGEIYAGYYPNTSVYISFSPDDDWYVNDIRVVYIEFVHESNFTITDAMKQQNGLNISGILYERDDSGDDGGDDGEVDEID